MSSAAGHEVTVIGNAIVDEVHRGGRVEEQLGGNGFNVAVALGSSGVRTCLVARFAADDAGRAFVESLRLRGVTIVRQPAIVSTDRARAFLTGPEPHYEFSSTLHLNVDFSPEVIATLGTSRAVVVNSYPFENLDDVEDLLAALQEVQGMRVLDPNPRPGRLSSRTTFTRHLDLLLAHTDIVKVSSSDLALLYGSTEEAAIGILERGPSVVILTKGAAGAEVLTTGGGSYSSPADEWGTPVINAVGAGDAVLASIVIEILAEWSKSGHRTSARAVLGTMDWQSHLDRAMRAAGVWCRQISRTGLSAPYRGRERRP
jgi:fructokinase